MPFGQRATASRYCAYVSHVHSMPARIASAGMSSARSRFFTTRCFSSGRHGARVNPQLPMTTLVTPCQHEHVPSGSHATCASMWVWPSMKPGGDDLMARVDLLAAARVDGADARDAIADDADVGAVARKPGTVHHRAAANHEIVAHVTPTRVGRRAPTRARRHP